MATSKRATKPTKDAVPKPAATYKNQAVEVTVRSNDLVEFAEAIACKLTRPEVTAAGVIENWQKDTHDVNQLVSELARQVEAVNSGDLARAEAMLISQAHALDNIFANLARRATSQKYLKQWDAYMRMAMKAQNQCRMTLETLAEIKNPRAVAFVRQANIANGPQQVVNGASPVSEHSAQARAGAGNSSIEQSRLLEQQHGQWLDTGAQGTAGGADSQLEAVGAVYRAKDRGR